MKNPLTEADVFCIVDKIFKQNPNGAWVSLRWNPKKGTAGDWIKGPNNVTPVASEKTPGPDDEDDDDEEEEELPQNA